MTDVPRRMRKLPTFRGLPVPYVQFIGEDGQPDFKVIDEGKKVRCLKERLCGLCGEFMRETLALIGGEKSVESRLFTDPPMHVECARYAAKVCPFLANSDAKYSPAAPKHLDEGHTIMREYEAVCPMRSKRMAIYFTKSYKFGLLAGRGPMIYIQAGPPTSIDWTAMPETPDPKPTRVWRPGDEFTDKERDAGVKVHIGLDLEDMPELLDKMPNGCGVLMGNERQTPEGRCPDAHEMNTITAADLMALSDVRGLFHVLSALGRPGAQTFFHALEHQWFMPGTPLNDLYQYRIFKWHDLLWAIASVPTDRQAICHEVAKSCRMRLADGIPMMVGDEDGGGGKFVKLAGARLQAFPLAGPNVFSLSNDSDQDTAVYKGPGGEQDERIREKFDIEQIERQTKARMSSD